jgi:hypothetical protein
VQIGKCWTKQRNLELKSEVKLKRNPNKIEKIGEYPFLHDWINFGAATNIFCMTNATKLGKCWTKNSDLIS